MNITEAKLPLEPMVGGVLSCTVCMHCTHALYACTAHTNQYRDGESVDTHLSQVRLGLMFFGTACRMRTRVINEMSSSQKKWGGGRGKAKWQSPVKLVR